MFLLEGRLGAILDIYIYIRCGYPLFNNLEDILVEAISSRKPLDNFIRVEDTLYVEGASSGSFWVTLGTKSQVAYIPLRSSVLLLLPEGRSAIRRRIESETERQELEVE